MKKWKFVSCHREDDSLDIIAEVQVGRHHYLTSSNIESLVDAMLDEVGDDGELEYEWEISPAILTHRFPQEHYPILEVALRVKIPAGRMTRPVVGLDADTIGALKRQHRRLR